MLPLWKARSICWLNRSGVSGDSTNSIRSLGYLSQYAGISSISQKRAKAAELPMRSNPLASLIAGLSDSSASSNACITFCAAVRKRSPSCVSRSTREVRWNRRTPRRFSSLCTTLLMVDGSRSKLRAAAEKLVFSETRGRRPTRECYHTVSSAHPQAELERAYAPGGSSSRPARGADPGAPRRCPRRPMRPARRRRRPAGSSHEKPAARMRPRPVSRL